MDVSCTVREKDYMYIDVSVERGETDDSSTLVNPVDIHVRQASKEIPARTKQISWSDRT